MDDTDDNKPAKRPANSNLNEGSPEHDDSSAPIKGLEEQGIEDPMSSETPATRVLSGDGDRNVGVPIMAEAEGDERLTKAELIALGIEAARKKRKARQKARERAAQERAAGLLTITLKAHKDERSLVMGIGKNVIKTITAMRQANLDPAALSEHLNQVLRDYYKSNVQPHLRKGKS